VRGEAKNNGRCFKEPPKEKIGGSVTRNSEPMRGRGRLSTYERKYEEISEPQKTKWSLERKLCGSLIRMQKEQSK